MLAVISINSDLFCDSCLESLPAVFQRALIFVSFKCLSYADHLISLSFFDGCVLNFIFLFLQIIFNYEFDNLLFYLTNMIIHARQGNL